MKTGQTIFVGMSGGVDSSVAALRLKNQGYNVVGVFIKVWHPDFMVCNWEQERLDAMRVAAHLKLPFLTCDAEAVYRDEVAAYFISEYQAGRTPNPDVMCNQKVKFGAFIDFARAHGADHVATGHYVQKKQTNGTHGLYRGSDDNKDQSYFLWSLTPQQLGYSLFPVGDTTKEEIRKEAKQARLPVAEKEDSQGICFLGHVDIPEFLSHYTALVPGEVLNQKNERIGTHRGALVYTLGQRHGFTIHTADNNRAPLYVIDKNISRNTITVGTEKPTISNREKILLHDVQLRHAIKSPANFLVQFRYRQTPLPATVTKSGEGKLEITPSHRTDTPAVGQSAVIYRDTLCLGGGVVV